MRNILSFDVEEYFQVSGLEKAISRQSWDSYPSRVGSSVSKLLDILAEHKVKATFFVLGWIAQKHPQVVKQIAAAGHEIACHGYDHRLVYHMTVDEFKEDVRTSAEMLRQLTGQPVVGYRAASFSLAANDLERFMILAELGFRYDSSLFPIKHFRYGKALGIPLAPFEIRVGDKVLLKEFPLTAVRFLGRLIPAGGGGYLRLYPLFFAKRNIRRVNKEGRPAILYLHPWEFDPEQPRVRGVSFGNSFRHYYNLHKTESKLTSLLKYFTWGPFCDDMRAPTTE